MTDLDQSLRWLGYLFEDCDPDGWAHLFSIDANGGPPRVDWAPLWDLGSLAAPLAEIVDSRNVWFGVTTRTHRIPDDEDGKPRRGGAADVGEVPALWLDVDYLDPVHKTDKPLPPADAARAIVASFPLKPSAVVDSGHGLHAYWLFTEPLDVAEVTAEAESILADWHWTWASRFQAEGYHLDRVSDLARVLRIPGSLNHKGGMRVPVTEVLPAERRTYLLDEILDYLQTAPEIEPTGTIEAVGSRPTDTTGTPGGRYNAEHAPDEVLLAHGWTFHSENKTAGERHYTRPGKDRREGLSATVYPDGTVNVWSDASDLPQGERLDAFGLFARLSHGGDFSAAARSLSESNLDRFIGSLPPVPEIPATPQVGEKTGLPAVELVLEMGGTHTQNGTGEVAGDGPRPLVVRPPSPPFPIDALPEPLRSQVIEVSRAIQTPLDLAATVGLGVLSVAATEARARLRLTDQWVEGPNIYAVVAMPPGAGKSPAVSAMTSALDDLARSALAGSLEERSRAEARASILDKSLSSAVTAASKAENAIERAAATSKAEGLAVERADLEIPSERTLLADDVTAEALGQLLYENGGRIGVLSAEGGFLDALSRYTDSASSNIDALLQSWSGDTLRVKRIGAGRTFEVQDPRATVALTIQPSVLRALLANREFAGRGLTPRFMMSEPPSYVGHRDFSEIRSVDPATAQAWDATVNRVADHRGTLALDPDALSVYLEWKGANEILRRSGSRYSGQVAEHTIKAESTVLRVAMLLHLAGNDHRSTSIGVEAVRRAIALGDYWIDQAVRLIGSAPDSEVESAIHLLRWWSKGTRAAQTFSVAELGQRGPTVPGTKDRMRKPQVIDALEVLYGAGWVVAEGNTEPRSWRLVSTDLALIEGDSDSEISWPTPTTPPPPPEPETPPVRSLEADPRQSPPPDLRLV